MFFRLLIASTDFTNYWVQKTLIALFARYGNSRMTKSAKTYIRLKAVITFNHVERSPLIKSIKFKSLIAMFVN